MKAILLDGSLEHDRTGKRVGAILKRELQNQGWQVEHYALCEQKIGNCAGDFFCWVRTPGICNVDDDNRAIAAAVINSDLMVHLTPVTYGGYSPTLKKMVDHLIQNVSPFFALVGGETHHRKRYEVNPDLLVVGWMEAPDMHSEAIFRHLVQRNAVNWHAENSVGDVILENQSDEEIQAAAGRWVADLQSGRSSHPVELPVFEDHRSIEPMEIRRATLLVGSPKTRKSTSNSLGTYLFDQLKARSIRTETIYPHTVLRSPRRMEVMLEAVENSDLVMLAFPIYVDTLPAPVIETLQRIAEHRQGKKSRRQLFTAIANCGFPEAYQCDNALAVCENFASQAGFEWAGGLALGGGEVINGASLEEGGGKTIRMRQSLELAAEALAQGQAIPAAAREGLATPIIPHWLYRLTGWLRWNRWAKRYAAKKMLKNQPYLA